MYNQIWNRAWFLSVCFGVMVALSTIALIDNVSAANGSNIIMIDNYNDGVLGTNSLGYWTGWDSSGDFIVEEVYLHRYDVNLSKNNNARKITYNCPNPDDYAWHVSNAWDDITVLDISDFEYLSFRVKMESANDGCYIKIRYGGSTPLETELLYAGDYCAETDEWQLVNVPLSDFIGLDKTTVTSIIFLFDNSLPLNTGTLYIDNLEFSKGYAKQESTGSVRIEGATKTLFVDGEPFSIKGVGYQPLGIGQMPPDPINPLKFDRDFPLLVEMGCNTIRTWAQPGFELMNKAEEYGLKVLAGFWIDPHTDYANIGARQNIKSDFRNFINAYKDSPALLMWGIGNENNYHAGFNTTAYYSLANELAEIAYQEEGAAYHPVIIVNGSLYWLGSDEAGTEDLQLNYIDAWGSNLYSRKYSEHGWLGETRDIFEVYKQKSDKPLVITEYGVDAFRTTRIDWDPVYGLFVATEGYEDENMQADWDKNNTLEIMDASDVCLGSSLMAYSDEWWKYLFGSVWDHDLGGGRWWDGNQPDDYSNEEYYGIVQIAPDGTWDEGDGLEDIRPRQVYYVLKGIFLGEVPEEVLTVDDYNDGNPNVNTLGYWTGGDAAMAEVTEPNYDGSQCRKFDYLNNNWYASNLWNDVTYMNIVDYDSLNFAIKGAQGGESIIVELQYGTDSIALVNFYDITTQWQAISTSLSDFQGLDKTKMRSISLVFQGSGTIYLDNLGFGKTGSPVNLPPVVTDIPDQTINEGESFASITLDDYVSDPDNADSDITWSSSGNTNLIVDIDPATRIATITYAGWTGQETVTFRATDPGGEYDETSAIFTVNYVNLPPVVMNIPDQTINEGESFASITLDNYVADPDNIDSDITWSSSGNTNLIVDIDPATRIATITYAGWTGQETVTFRATDPGGEYDETSAEFRVDAVVSVVMVVDDFNDYDLSRNSLGFWTGGNLAMEDTTENSYDGSRCRKFSWWGRGWSSWYATNVWDGINYADASDYNYLSFVVKGNRGGERLAITLYYGANASAQVKFSGITTQWQAISIPLTDFGGLNKTQLRYIGIAFKDRGTIYMDNLEFSN